MSFFKRFTSKKSHATPQSSEADNVREFFIKIALLGEGGVGKTSLRRRYMGAGFTTEHLMTIGADFASITKEYDDAIITWQIWDLAGQENFRNVRNHYFKGCMGGLVVFDVTDKKSFVAVKNWIKELFKHNGRGKVPIILLGNKIDLPNKTVSSEDIQQLLEELNKDVAKEGFTVHYLETSAKDGINVHEAFDTLGRQILKWIKTHS